MSWITLTADDVGTRFTAPEMEAIRRTLVVSADPLPDVVASVVSMVRGRVGACARNTLGLDGTIPANLKSTALAIAAWELLSRLPLAALATEARKLAYEKGLKLLEDVAACKFVVDMPENPAPAGDIATGPGPSWKARPPQFKRWQQDGA